MDRREVLNELEDKYVEFAKQLGDYKKQLEGFESSTDYEKYTSYIRDEVRQEMYPEQYAIYQEIDKVNAKIEPFCEDIINAAKNLRDDLNEKLNVLNDKVKKNEDYLKGLDSRIEALKSELVSLKDSEEYKRGDSDAILRAEELEEDINSKLARKEKVAADLDLVKGEVEALTKEVKEVTEDYSLEEVSTEERSAKEAPTADEKTEEDKDESIVDTPDVAEEGDKEAEKTEEDKRADGKPKYTKGGKVITYADDIEKEDKEEEIPEEFDKKQFDTFYRKVKKKVKNDIPLTSDEFYQVAHIMNNKQDYDRLGISSGVVFNKSKVMLKALARSATDTDRTVKGVREKFDMEVDSPDAKKGIVSSKSIRKWDALKELANDPDTKIVSEELFRRVVEEVDKDSLDAEGVQIYDNAEKYLKKYELLRGALATYDTVSKERSPRKARFMDYMNGQPKALDASFVDEKGPNIEESELDIVDLVDEKGKSGIAGLENLTEDEPKYDEVPPRDDKTTSRDDR